MSSPNQTIYFNWIEATPDPRPFKPGMPKLQPIDVQVAVNVPTTNEYFFNAEKLLIEVVSPLPVPIKPILTPKGLKYAINQLETAMKDEETAKVESIVSDWNEDDGVSTSPNDDFIEFKLD